MTATRSRRNVKKDNSPAQYGEVASGSRYTYETGKIVIPLAKTESDSGVRYRIVQLHPPIGMRSVKCNATKKGTPPIMPRFEDTESDTLLSANIVMATPQVSGDQMNYIFSATSELHFVQDLYGTGSENASPEATGTNAWNGYKGRPRDTSTGFQTGEPQIVQAMLDPAIQSRAGDQPALLTGIAGPISPLQLPVVANGLAVNLNNPEQQWYCTYYGSQFFSSGVIS